MKALSNLQALKVFHVDPVSRPRMTRRDRWKQRKTVTDYWAFRDRIRLESRGASPWTPPQRGVHLIFVLPMPKSWTKKKKNEMLGKPHQQKPDVDNLVKGFFDCFGEDKEIWDVRATKIWGEAGTIFVFRDHGAVDLDSISTYALEYQERNVKGVKHE